jgi:hypothetical protein
MEANNKTIAANKIALRYRILINSRLDAIKMLRERTINPRDTPKRPDTGSSLGYCRKMVEMPEYHKESLLKCN